MTPDAPNKTRLPPCGGRRLHHADGRILAGCTTEAIREFGFRIPVVAHSDGTVIDGHLRLKAAQRLSLPPR